MGKRKRGAGAGKGLLFDEKAKEAFEGMRERMNVERLTRTVQREREALADWVPPKAPAPRKRLPPHLSMDPADWKLRGAARPWKTLNEGLDPCGRELEVREPGVDLFAEAAGNFWHHNDATRAHVRHLFLLGEALDARGKHWDALDLWTDALRLDARDELQIAPGVAAGLLSWKEHQLTAPPPPKRSKKRPRRGDSAASAPGDRVASSMAALAAAAPHTPVAALSVALVLVHQRELDAFARQHGGAGSPSDARAAQDEAMELGPGLEEALARAHAANPAALWLLLHPKSFAKLVQSARMELAGDDQAPLVDAEGAAAHPPTAAALTDDQQPPLGSTAEAVRYACEEGSRWEELLSPESLGLLRRWLAGAETAASASTASSEPSAEAPEAFEVEFHATKASIQRQAHRGAEAATGTAP